MWADRHPAHWRGNQSRTCRYCSTISALIAASRYESRKYFHWNAGQAAALMQHDWPGNCVNIRNLGRKSYGVMGACGAERTRARPRRPERCGHGHGQQTLARDVGWLSEAEA